MIGILKNYWKEVLIGVLVLICYAQYSGKSRAEETIKEYAHQVSVLKMELSKTKTEITERIQTVIVETTKPDGTVVKEKKITETKTKETEKETVNIDERVDTVVKKDTKVNDIERYTVGLDYAILSGSYNVDVAARLGNLPLFGVIRSEDNFHNVALGVRLAW